MSPSMVRSLCLLVLATVAGCRTGSSVTPTPPQKPPATVPPGAPAAVTPAEQKLDLALLDLVKTPAQSGGSLQAWAAKHKVETTADRIAVDITCAKAADVPAVVASLKAAGAEIKTTFENVVFASVPATAIAKVAELNQVWSMALSRPTTRPVK